MYYKIISKLIHWKPNKIAKNIENPTNLEHSEYIANYFKELYDEKNWYPEITFDHTSQPEIVINPF